MAWLISDADHGCFGPEADSSNIRHLHIELEKPEGLAACAGGKTVLVPPVRNINHMH